MTQTISFELEMPGDLGHFRLPQAAQARLQTRLHRLDEGIPLTPAECDGADGGGVHHASAPLRCAAKRF